MSHYRILEPLGGGGMGEVYLAEDERLPGRRVAVKLLREDLRGDEASRRFFAEATAAASLDHPGISQIHEVDRTEDGRPFLVMPHYGGGSLRDRLDGKPLDPEETCRIALQIAGGLEHAHAHGIVHRDIKPGNLMFTNDGFVKIVDFGLARFLGRTRITVSGTQLGTVSYMSPEQAAGEDVDERTDIWSLGVVMYEMLTGDLPFRAGNPQVQIFSIRNDPCPPLRKSHPEVPEACARIVHRCLEKNRDRRYQDMGELIEDLVALSRDRGWSSHLARRGRDSGSGASSGVRPRPRGRLGRYSVLAAVALAVVAAGGYAWHEWRNRPPSAEAPFVTDLRVAVLPFKNRIGAEGGELAEGLTEVASETAVRLAAGARSMWVLPMRHVRFADLPEPSRARKALGVNRVVTGELQRYQSGQRLSLSLHDPGRAMPLRTVNVDYRPDDPENLVRDLPERLAELLGLDPAGASAAGNVLPPQAAAVVPYLLGRGALEEDPDAATADLQTSSRSAPDFLPARAWLARARIRQFRASGDSALLVLARQDLRLPDSTMELDGVACASLGDVFYELGQTDSSVTWHTRAVGLDPHDSWSANMAVRVLRTEGRFDEAADLLRRVIAAEPDNFANRCDLGLHYYRAGKNPEAAREISRALSYAPEDAWSLNLLGAIHLDDGNWTEAAAAFEQSLRLVPDCDACSNVGLIHFYQGDMVSAAEYYEYALALCDTTEHTTWSNLAKCLYWIDGQRDRAIALYGRAIQVALAQAERSPDDVGVYSHLVDYYAMCGRASEAHELLGHTPSGVQEDPDALYRLGCALEKLGERSRALEYISEAIRHGTPVAMIKGTPELEDLVRDVRFEKLALPGDSPAP